MTIGGSDRSGGSLPRGAFTTQRFGLIDMGLVLAATAVYVLAPGYLPLATNVVIMCALALSLDLVVGFAGIDTLGQAAFFGAGAYAAGLYALHLSAEPISGLLVGAAAAAVIAILSAPVILRTKGLSLVMLTLAVAAVLREIANSARSLTMGDDGLSGYAMKPIVGLFPFDIEGRTAFVYAFLVLLLLAVAARRIVNSVFGLSLRGIRDNSARTSFLGIGNLRHLCTLYAMAAAIAGCAGALSAQIIGIVGLDSFSFLLSGNVMVALVIGGVGTLYGAFIGSILFVVVSDRAAAVDPVNWLFALGFGSMLLVYFAPKGVMGGLRELSARRKARGVGR
jgi:branched-chain amino acid transport system permease protein